VIRARTEGGPDSLRVDQPEIHVVIYPDGTDNLPSPKNTRQEPGPTMWVNIAIRRYEVNHGLVEVGVRAAP
jgi:translocation and assembly module TamB